MRLTTIPQIARNANRLREIATILSKYSLADWMSRLDFDFVRSLFQRGDGLALTRLSHETRIRLALTELGPTFIKLGQMLSTRPDLVGPALAQELSLLQTAAPADPPAVVHATIEAELKRPVAELFAEFDDQPLASASIGQVHRATLKDGQRVVVKVQHQGIEARIKNDLEILLALAEVAEKNLAELAQYRPRETVAQFQRMLLHELDFGREERNLQQFALNFADEPLVHFPRPFPDFSTSRVLTMEFLEGIPITDPERLRTAGFDPEDIARRGATIYLEMIFRDGFYHADPHPGNVLVLANSALGIIDCGMVGRLDEQLREDIEELLLTVVRGDADRLTALITRIGSVPPKLDQAGLKADVADFVSYYANQPLHKLQLSRALTDMVDIIRRYHILLPPPLALLIKVLVMLEGTSRQLNPRFEMIELIKPFQKKVIWRRLSPRRRLEKWRRLYQEWEQLGRALPRSLLDLLQQAQTGRLEVHLEHKKLESSINRLVFGLMTSALFLGSSWMLSSRVPPAPYDVSIPGAIGCLLSLLQALRLFWAIKKSGKLDQ